MASNRTTTMMTPLATATLSRFSRIQAIWESERPWIFFPPTPSRTSSGPACSDALSTSSGAVMGYSPSARSTLPTGALGYAVSLVGVFTDCFDRRTIGAVPHSGKCGPDAVAQSLPTSYRRLSRTDPPGPAQPRQPPYGLHAG